MTRRSGGRYHWSMSTIAIMMALAIAATAPEGPAEKARDEAGHETFPAGEVLVYRVKFSWFSAGTATMAVYKVEDVEGVEGLRGQKIIMRTVSHGLARRIMRVDDVATTWIDPSTAGTVYYRFDKSEEDKREVETLLPVPGGKVEYYRKKSSGKEGRASIEPVGDGPPVDTLSMFYYLRTVDLKLNEPVSVTVYQDKAYPLELTPVSMERVKVLRVGTFNAFKVRPKAAAPGLFSKEGDATFWLEEKTHVLLRMVLDVKYGSSSMCLARVKNSPLLSAPGGPEHEKK